MRFKYRIKYAKGPEMRFVSHLDLMRLFQRAIRRAGLPIGYSHGFNPHQLMSFGNPLSLGMTSIGEYCDIELESELEAIEIAKRLNAVMNSGISILGAVRLPQGALTAMADLCACRYEAFLDNGITGEMVKKNIKGFLEQEEILAMKKTKSSLKKTDIRPDIFEIEDISDESGAKLSILLAAGSTRSLRADLTVQTFCDYMGVEFNKYRTVFRRIDMYSLCNDKLVPLGGEVVAP